ncbi:MAG: GTP 3',8-cyclase MoaA [Parasporobacterium sp.]|nr:GTP 3',8-cyclase MoaA [Parasporobacterium sp.]
MIDNYGRKITYLRLSVTELCNLRCRYCMPENGICLKKREDMLTEEEMISAVRAAARMGINKVRITGGEPLVKKNIISICRNISSIDGIDEVCLTTNGILLPEMAADLKSAGVKRVNISLDTLDPEKFSHITRRNEHTGAMRGLKAALEAGFEKVKINAVLIGGFNDDEIPALAELTVRYPVDVRFIELMPMYDSGDFGKEAYISCSKVVEALPELLPVQPDGGVAELFRLPGAKGNIGLINPVSAHFCGSCSRLRITADGYIKPCLHSPAEFYIKGMNEEEMYGQLIRAVNAKPEWHGEMSAQARSRAGRNMNRIGG